MDLLKQLDVTALEYFQKEAGNEAEHVLNTLAKALEMSSSKEDDKYISTLKTAAMLIKLPIGQVKMLLGLIR